jgi:hypothetical protein
MSDLASTLFSAAKPSQQYVTPDGSRLLLLPYGARVLGLFPPGSNESFFWTHPDLDSRESAEAFFRKTEWHNTGGDRTWLAPEVDLSFPDYPDTRIYRVPVDVDPGNYAAIPPSKIVRLQTPFTVTLSRGRAQVRGYISKSWSPAPNPLRYQSVWRTLTGVTYAGYTQNTSLELLPGEGSVALALWSLLALPPGGEMLVPTFHRCKPEIYSGPIDGEDLIITDHLVRFRMTGTGIQKIGIPASASTGRIAAIYPTGEAWAIVVRNFFVNPSGEYVDVPWNNYEAKGDFLYATQACRINNELGTYCELEYHTPAIGIDAAQCRSEDCSQVWAFRGSREAMQQIAKYLISEDMN